MTENQAKTKRCWKTRGGVEGPCIGSQCMAWRWVAFGSTGFREYFTMEQAKAAAAAHHPVWQLGGYCGKVGFP